MKTKQTLKFAVTAFALITGTQHLPALPQWPQDVQAVRNLVTPKLPEGYQKAIPEQREAMLKAADFLIRYDSVFCPYIDKIYTHHWQAVKQDLNDLGKAPFTKQLPEPFATAFFKVTSSLEQVKQLPAAYGDDDLKDNKTLPENWAILDAICRDEFGFSLEQQCALFRSRIWNLGYDVGTQWYIRARIASDGKKGISQHNREVDQLLKRLLAPNNYQGDADPELRKTIFDWYQADFIKHVNQKSPITANPVNPPNNLPSDLLDAALHETGSIAKLRAFEDEMRKKYGDNPDPRKWTDLERHNSYRKKQEPSSARKKLDFALIQYVGIGKAEYAEQLTTILGQTIAKKTGINVDYFTGRPESPADLEAYEKAKAETLTEWQTNGFPAMPLPYAGPRPLFLDKNQFAPAK